MLRKEIRLSAIFTIVLILSFTTVLAQKKLTQNKLPNIVLLYVDDLGWTDLACYGSSFYETPNIDRLAASGMKFTNGYSPCTVCSPSRASMLTGKNPARLRITDWITGHNMPYAKLLPPDWTQHLPLEEITIAELLKNQEYATANIGKWHLGDDVKYYPEHQGFDINIGGNYAGQPGSYFSPYNTPRLKDGPPGEYLTDRQTIEAEKFIRQNTNRPFFLYLSYYAVHTPLQAKKEDIEYFKSKINSAAQQKNATYAAMIKSTDESVGRIMAVLDQLDLTENTLIVFTSDNGGLIGGRRLDRDAITSNKPLRMGKGSNYEGGIRVPFIFSWKGRINAGTESSVPIIGSDLFSTFAGISGSKISSKQKMDGVNLFPLLTKQKQIKRKELYWHYPHYHPEGGTPHTAIREGYWKLIYFYEDGKKELYNLNNDTGELQDLSTSMPNITNRLYKKLVDWKKQSGAQEPILNSRYDSGRATEVVAPPKRKVSDEASNER